MYANRLPLDELAELRQTAPIWWNSKPLGQGGFPDEGFWVVTKHHDGKEVSRNSDVFSSRENTAIIRFRDDMPRDNIEMQRLLLLNMDPPTHTKQRGIISRGFTPRAINSLRDALSTRAEQIVATAKAKGSGDFVSDVACELPLQAIAELIGIPQDD